MLAASGESRPSTVSGLQLKRDPLGGMRGPMRSIAIILLFLVPVSSRAADFYLVFERSDFLGGYHDRIYIHGSKAIHIRQEGVTRPDATAKTIMPTWKSIDLSSDELAAFVAQMKKVGVQRWKAQYP